MNYNPLGMATLLVCHLICGESGSSQTKDSDGNQTQALSARHELVSGQSARKQITINMKDVPLRKILTEIDSLAGGLRMSYSPAAIPLDRIVSLNVKSVSPEKALFELLKGLNIRIEKGSEGQILLLPSPSNDSSVNQATGSIKGVVIDSATKQPLPGVTISIVGSAISFISGKDGAFKLGKVPVGKRTLNVKVLGYQTQSIQVTVENNRESSLTITLKPAATSLSEVVTTATGTQRRVEVANDIVKINADQIRERAPVRNVIDMIEAAQVPGVLVTRGGGDPGAPSRIRIRGIGSISQSNDPVMIVDGVWIDATMSQPSRLDDIDPASIETIEIIRGPSAATLFGQDAANGVIVVTTKKGRAGPTRWTFSYNRDWGQTYGTHPLFYRGIGTNTDGLTGLRCPIASILDYSCRQDTVLVYDPNNSLLSREGVETKNRYVIQMEGGAPNVTYALTLSTGNTVGVRRVSGIDKIRYGILGYRPDSEFSTPSGLKRNSIVSSIVLNPRSNLTMNLSLTGTQSNLKDNSLENSWRGLPVVGFGMIDYSLDTTFGTYGGGTITAVDKPTKTTTGVIASTIQYRPRDQYVINANLGAEQINTARSKFGRRTNCRIDTGCADSVGYRQEESETRSVYTARLNASTSLNLGPFNKFLDVRPTIGGDFKKTDNASVFISKDSIPIGDKSINMGNFVTSRNAAVENAIAGWFVSSTIGLFSRIYFDVGVRQDIGSAITSTNDAIYPKIGGSWLVSDEGFWRENSFINSFRLRSAIGHSAVQPDPSDINGRFTHNVEYVKGKIVKSVNLQGPGNSRLQPERSIELELGFDLDMLSDRLNLIGTFAHKENKNTLVVRSLPPSFGPSSTRKENVAKVRNENFELSATGRAIETHNMLLILNYALTVSANKVVNLGNGITPFSQNESRIVGGYPLAGVWSKRVLGYRDRNRDGLLARNEVVLSDSLVYMGWSQPGYRASYGFSFTLNNQFVFDSRFAYQSEYVQDYRLDPGYGSEDQSAPLHEQAAFVISGINGKKPVSDLRWNSASITYRVPASVLKRFGGRSVSVSLQGSNLGLWTNYVGRDPGINTAIMDGEVMMDNGKTPPAPRMYVLDFKVGF